MPGGDGTGPMGLGQMTGREAGYCAGFAEPGYANQTPGRGWGMGRGRGRGRGRGWRHPHSPIGIPDTPPKLSIGPYDAAPSAEYEVRALKAQAERIEGSLNEIRKRIAGLEAAQEKES